MLTPVFFAAVLFFSPVSPQPETVVSEAPGDSIAWMKLEAVDKIVTKNIKKNKVKENKLIIVDFYTDWCGWCKKLDSETYVDPEVIALMNKYFYPVKFDAEQQDSVQFANKTYKFKGNGNRGTNEFALEFATRPGGRIGYPSMTIIDPMGVKINVEAGFKNPDKMKVMLLYYGEGHYKTKDFPTFQKEYEQKQLTD